MKRFIAMLALAISISASTFAQAAKENAVTMQNGKVMVIKDGVASELKDRLVTANGHIFSPDGNVIKNTGSVTLMKEGEKFDMNGDKIPSKSFNNNSGNVKQRVSRQ